MDCNIVANAFASSNFYESLWSIAFYGVIFVLSLGIVSMIISNLLGLISPKAKVMFDLIDIFSSIYK